MVGVLASSEVDRVFESRSGQTNDYTNWYLLFTGWLEIMIMCPSGRHVYPRTVVSVRYLLFTEWLEIMIMCPSGASCLSTNCCFSELALLKN
jgi:hypothetical protein